jgi:hypothetical protein
LVAAGDEEQVAEASIYIDLLSPNICQAP